MAQNESAVTMEALFGEKTAVEKAIENVTPEDAAATTKADVIFKFRDLLPEDQLAKLKKNAPAVSERMVQDYNQIFNFGGAVLQKMNDASTAMLNAQRGIDVPEAEYIVNDLLREIDGYNKKFSYVKQVDGLISKIKDMFGSARYSLKAMIRESKPIADKLVIAEGELRNMELKLEDNITRGRQLHKQINETLDEVVTVLAALEEIIEVSRADLEEIEHTLEDAKKGGANDMSVVEYKGKRMSNKELDELRTMYVHGVGEMEKTWFDWRQQFFLGYAQAPSILNISLVSASMRRRVQVFRTMGIPSARSSLAMWQQAALAKAGAEMGNSVSDGTNRLVQDAFAATGDAVTEVAKAAQSPVLSQETVLAAFNSIQAQCEALVTADREGREARKRNIAVMEQSERGIKETFDKSRSELIKNALNSTAAASAEAAATDNDDLLAQLGRSA